MNSARVINRLFGTATVVTVACLVGTVAFNVAETVDYRVRAAELAVITLPKKQRLTLQSMRLAPQFDVAAISRETPLLLIGTAAECALCDAAAVTYAAVIARLSRSGTAVQVMAFDASTATRPRFEMPGIPSRRLPGDLPQRLIGYAGEHPRDTDYRHGLSAEMSRPGPPRHPASRV